MGKGLQHALHSMKSNTVHNISTRGLRDVEANALQCVLRLQLALQTVFLGCNIACHAARGLQAQIIEECCTSGHHAMAGRPHASLWLAKTCVVPAGMYASQVPYEDTRPGAQ
eukprot:23473-Pelagomonas_calceolata.AAC.1